MRKIISEILLIMITLPVISACGGSGSGSSSGPEPWTRLTGATTKSTTGNCIASDPDGNIYIAGSTDGSLDGQTYPGSAYEGGFLSIAISDTTY